MSTQEQKTMPPAAGTVARQEFGASQLAVQAETASTAIAAQSQATVQARYIVAMQRPRDWDDVKVRVMREIERPGFAEVAWFRKPIGAGVEGLSVRFTDMAARCMGNLLEEAPVVYEDATKRIVRVTVTDLEANLTKFKDVAFEKTVERSSLADGRAPLSSRKNSQGKTTYTVPATEDELLAKEGALTSKARRNLILQVLPGDIQDAAKVRILQIRHGGVATDPDGARRKVIEAFAALNVMPSDLKAYLGHDVASCSPVEIQELRDLYSTLAEGTTTWAEVMDEKVGAGDPEKTKSGIESLKDKLKAAAATGPKPEASASTATAAATEALPDREPGADDDEDTVKKFVEATVSPAQPAVDCVHPNLKRPIPRGKAVVCPDCTLEVRNDSTPRVSE